MKKIFLLALVIRLISLYLFRNISNYDLQSYLQIGELTLKGLNIYPDVANLHHPYLPFFLYIEALAFYLGSLGGLGRFGTIAIIKAINIIFDLAIVQLVYLLSKKNFKTAFLYAINPVTILITTLHGQFDVIPIFFILLTIYLLQQKKELASILSFSFAVLTKTWPILFFIPIARRIKNKRLLNLIIIFPILFSLFYSLKFKTNLINIVITVSSYQGLWGIWPAFVPIIIGTLAGKGVIVGLFWQKLSTIIFLISFILYSWLIKEKNLVKIFLSLLFFFFIFTANFAIQYFSWLMPFLILTKPKKTLQLIILITFYLFFSYYFWLFCYHCEVTPQWLVITQNIIGFILWFSFIKVWYLSRKIS